MAYCFDCRHFFLDEFIIVIIRIALMRKQYLGLSGYNKIKKNQLKRNDLKKHNKAEYNRLAIKLNHFDEISDMLKAGKFIIPNQAIIYNCCRFYGMSRQKELYFTFISKTGKARIRPI